DVGERIRRGARLERLDLSAGELRPADKDNLVARWAAVRQELTTIYPLPDRREVAAVLEGEVAGAAARAVEQERLIARLAALADEKNKKDEPPAHSCIISHGNRCYQIGNHEPVAVSDPADDVLQAFLDRPAMDESQLV